MSEMKRWVTCALVLVAMTTAQPADAKRVRTKRVKIESKPAGAQVFLGEKGPLVGTTPMKRAKLPVGTHSLVFKKEGHQTATVPLKVTRNGHKVMAQLVALAMVHVTPGNVEAQAATLMIDGLPAGTVPSRHGLKGGRHLITVDKPGFQTQSQWLDLKEGESLSLPVLLQRVKIAAGSILVTSDTPGARVRLNGEDKGIVPNVLDAVPVGIHTIEVVSGERKPFKLRVEVKAGAREVVEARLAGADGATGGILVMANIDGAAVKLDGSPVGKTPFRHNSVPVGEHILEVVAEGYTPLQETVVIVEGKRRAVAVHLEAAGVQNIAGGAFGGVVVRTTTPGAMIQVEDRPPVRAPAEIADLPAGKYTVVVSAPGFQSMTTTCDVEVGANCSLDVQLVQGGAAVAMEANVEGAELFVDGQSFGSLPFSGALPTGKRRLEVRAAGHQAWVRSVVLEDSPDARTFSVTLKQGSGGTTTGGAVMSHTGRVLPPGTPVVDISLGYVHLLEVGFDFGIADWIDVGANIRTFGRLTEFEAHTRVAWRPIELISFGARLRGGGGVGADDTNDGFVMLEALFSFHIVDMAGLTAFLAADFYSDFYRFAETDSDKTSSETGRQNSLAMRVGGTVDVVLDERWNVWLQTSWSGVRVGGRRRILGDMYGSGNQDLEFSLRAGATVKF